MFWGIRTSSYNVVTFWLKLASPFYALFLSLLSRVHGTTAMLLVQFFYHRRLTILFLQLFAVHQFLMT